jgi:hypothetical protein
MPAVKGEPHRLCGAKTIAKDAGQLSATDNQHGSVLNLEISKTVKGASSSRFQIPPPPLHTRLEPAWLSPFSGAVTRVCGASACM